MKQILNISSFSHSKQLFLPSNKKYSFLISVAARIVGLHSQTNITNKCMTFISNNFKCVNKFSYPMNITNVQEFVKYNNHLNIKINVIHTRDGINYHCIYINDNNTSSISVNLLMIEHNHHEYYILIKNLSKFLQKRYFSSRYDVNGVNKVSCSKTVYCDKCLQRFSNETYFLKHTNCTDGKKQHISLTDQIMKYNMFQLQVKTPILGFIDFESYNKHHVCETCHIIKCDCQQKIKSKIIFSQEPITYAIVFIDTECNDVIYQDVVSCDNAADTLIEELMSLQPKLFALLRKKTKMKISVSQQEKHNKETVCYLCKKTFSDVKNYKTRDHNHYTYGIILFTYGV